MLFIGESILQLEVKKNGNLEVFILSGTKSLNRTEQEMTDFLKLSPQKKNIKEVLEDEKKIVEY